MFRSALGLIAASALLLVPMSSRAAIDLLAAVPADYEVVASLDTRQIIDSSTFKAAWPVLKKPKSDAQLAGLKAISGVDLMKDVDRVSLFSRVNDDDSVGVVFEGRFDEARLLVLVQANSTYKTYQQGGRAIHEWLDEGEDRLKFATFPEPGALILWNSKAAMEASVAAMGNPAGALKGTAEAKAVPADAATLAGWGILITRQETCPGAKLRVASATATMRLTGEEMNMTMTVAPEPAFATQWLDMAKGAKALAQIQRDNPMLAEMAGKVTFPPAQDGRVIEMNMTLANDELIDLATQVQH